MLVFLAAGVPNELNSQASTLQATNSFPNEFGASPAGQRQGSTWYSLDGVSHMDTYLLLALPFPNPDATQEFHVTTNNFDFALRDVTGRSSGGSNATNTHSYVQPDNNPTDSNCGQITGRRPVAPRVMQAALKLTF